MSAETRILIASKLYDARRTARAIGGEDYAATVAKWMEAVRTMAGGSSILTAAALMAETSLRAGRAIHCLWIFAAAVELIEPDAETPALKARGK